MALFMNDPAKRSELQEKLAAELRERTARTHETDGELPDHVDDSNYIRGTKRTTSLAWAWILIVIAIVVALVIIVMVI